MKINHYLDRSWFNGLRYTLHIMKIIIILLVLSIGNSFSMTYSQNTLLSLDINKQSIKEVIGIIEKKSEYVFFFSDNVRQDLEKSVDIKVNSKTLDVILNNLFADTDLVYTINDRQVSIAKSKKAGSSYPTPQQQTKTITGTIVDNTKEPLIGVNIVVKGTSTGTVTDIDGKFSLPITETNAVLVISYIGYKSQEIKVGNQSSLNGFIQDNGGDADLLRLNLSLDSLLYPQFSGHKSRFAIRFMPLDSENGQVPERLDFELACC